MRRPKWPPTPLMGGGREGGAGRRRGESELTMETPEAVVEAFQAAWNAHDMAALAALFTEPADFVNVRGMWWRDRATIEQRHAAAHAGPYRETVLQGELRALQPLAEDLALAHLDWRLSGLKPTQNDQIRQTKGILTFLLQRDAGGLRIRAAQNTEKSWR